MKVKKFIKENIVSLVIILLAVVTLILNRFDNVAKWLSGCSYAVTLVLGSLTSLVPFSLYGLVTVLALPILAGIILLFVFKKGKRLKVLCTLVAVAGVFVLTFYFVFGFGYSKDSVYTEMGIDMTVGNDKALLVETLDYYIQKANAEVAQLEREEGHTITDMSFDEQIDAVLEGFEGADLPFLFDIDLRPKAYFPSALMNYAGFTGVYCCPIAEVNVCTNVPPNSLPHTLAHELCHSKGVNNEGECNFVAILVCGHSGSAFVRYSGYSYAVRLLLNQLYSVDKQAHAEMRALVDERISDDFRYTSVFYAQFDTKIDDFFSDLNDAYLKSNKIPQGEVSYSLASRGLMAHYRQYIAVDNVVSK